MSQAFTAAVERSQALTTTHLQNQVDETVFLASNAKQSGAIAASAFGAGFGGSVWALVKDEDVAGFINKWKAAYSAAFPTPAKTSVFFPMVPGRGFPLFFLRFSIENAEIAPCFRAFD